MGPYLPDRFPDTRWSLIVEARQMRQGLNHGLGEWCLIYRDPVVNYLKALGLSVEEAEDVAHDFFTKLLERGPSSILPEKLDGRFRAYLQRTVRNFLTDHWRKQQRHKRGGHLEKVQSEQTLANLADDSTPEDVLGKSWVTTVIARASDALEKEMEASGRGDFLRAVGALLDGQKGESDRARLAQQFEMTDGAFRVALHRIRSRLRELVEVEIRQTVSNEEDFQDEVRYLFSLWT